jgi:glyoxylase-like metal-dependent hydrolase (beta-lactamase superfamily II)
VIAAAPPTTGVLDSHWSPALEDLLASGRAAGAELVEVFLERTDHLGVLAEQDTITSVTPAFGMGAGIRVFLVPGPTWGQQAVAFEDDRGRTVVFTPDVMPTRWHVGQAYSLAYDVEAYTSMVTKGWFLHEAAERGWTLVLDHEPGDAVCRVRRTEHWYELE